MQGAGHADVLLYFKCPVTKQMRYPVNAYNYSRLILKAHVSITRLKTTGFHPLCADGGSETIVVEGERCRKHRGKNPHTGKRNKNENQYPATAAEKPLLFAGPAGADSPFARTA